MTFQIKCGIINNCIPLALNNDLTAAAAMATVNTFDIGGFCFVLSLSPNSIQKTRILFLSISCMAAIAAAAFACFSLFGFSVNPF